MMGCGCKRRSTSQFVWTDGTNTVIYSTEIQAKAAVIRKGGTYTRKDSGT